MLIVRVEEGVLLAGKQGLVDVHSRTIAGGKRFGHKRGVNSPKLGQFLDEKPGRDHAVGHAQSVSVLEIYFMLALGCLVVGVFDGDTHLLQI